MSEPETRRLFERYQRGESTQGIEGSGLGLALTKEIIDAHGGRIDVKSELGVGSEFLLSLPTRVGETSNPAPTKPRSIVRIGQGRRDFPQPTDLAEAFRGQGERILLIEDSESDRRPMQDYLEKYGYRVDVATDGEEGHRRCLQEKPDLVVTDMMMPRISGSELCQMLKNDPDTASIPVIMITGRNNFGDMIFGIQMGADDYIAKPCNLQELLLRISALLRMQRIRNERDMANMKLTETDLIASSTGAIVHALKNPVVVIRNYVKWIREALDQSNIVGAKQRLNGIDDSAKTLSAFVDSMKRTDFREPKTAPVELRRLLDHVISELSSSMDVSGYNFNRHYGLSPVMWTMS